MKKGIAQKRRWKSGNYGRRGHIFRNVLRISIFLLFISCASFFWIKLIVAGSGIPGEAYIENSIGILSLIVSLVSAILIIVQLKEAGNIQEAEFIVNLNQSFVENEDYAKVYTELEKSDNKGHLEADVSRIQISNYFTFFETIYLLLEQGTIRMKVLDDLFAYRFFLAVHNEKVQKEKMVTSPYNFRNIYYLEEIWRNYRKKAGITIYKDYNCLKNACKRTEIAERNEIAMLSEQERMNREAGRINKIRAYNEIMDSWEKRRKWDAPQEHIIDYDEIMTHVCTADDVGEILKLQAEVIEGLEKKELLRRNTREMFEHCVQRPNLTIGLFHQDKLIAVGIMVYEKDNSEDLSADLEKFEVGKAANFKLVLVKKEYRGLGLQRALMQLIERYAYAQGYTHLCATVSKENQYSLKNIVSEGYQYDHSAVKYGGMNREVYVKDIKTAQKKAGFHNLEKLDNYLFENRSLAVCLYEDDKYI